MAPWLPCLQEIREKESVAALWQLLGSLVPASGVAAGVMERQPQPAAQVTVADRLGLGLPAGYHVVVAEGHAHTVKLALWAVDSSLTITNSPLLQLCIGCACCLLTVLPQTQLH